MELAQRIRYPFRPQPAHAGPRRPLPSPPHRKSGRAVECTGLENRRWATIRGFESHLFRQSVFRRPACRATRSVHRLAALIGTRAGRQPPACRRTMNAILALQGVFDADLAARDDAPVKWSSFPGHSKRWFASAAAALTGVDSRARNEAARCRRRSHSHRQRVVRVRARRSSPLVSRSSPRAFPLRIRPRPKSS